MNIQIDVPGIIEQLKSIDMSRKEVANTIGCSRAAVGHWLTGKREISDKYMGAVQRLVAGKLWYGTAAMVVGHTPEPPKPECYTYYCNTPEYKRKNKPEAWSPVNGTISMFRSYPFFSEVPTNDNISSVIR